jgi:hypothetical protein
MAAKARNTSSDAFTTVITLGDVLPLPAARDEGSERLKTLSQWARSAAHTHIVLLMSGQRSDSPWLKLGVDPGLCVGCLHAKLNETRRGTAYLRCTRAAWDTRLPRYPRLPVTQCVGFDPAERSPGVQQQGDGSAGGDLPGRPGDDVG